MTTLGVRAAPVRKLAVAFTVFGEPVSQGSQVAIQSKSTRRPMLKYDNEKTLKPWRGAVHNAGLKAMVVGRTIRPPFDGPLACRLVFTFDRPPSVKRDSPCVRPDGDKLCRAVWDALTSANVWVDDSRCVEATLRKVYVGLDPEALPRPGVRIAIWSITDQPDLEAAL